MSSDESPGAFAEHVLAFNSGSSSLKFGLYDMRDGRPSCVMSGEAHGIGEERSAFRVADPSGGPTCLETAPLRDPQNVVVRVGRWLVETEAPAAQAIGHRVVHGGPSLRRHCRIDDAVLHRLEAAQTFAPLHTPAVLSVIRSAQATFPGVPQVASRSTPAWA